VSEEENVTILMHGKPLFRDNNNFYILSFKFSEEEYRAHFLVKEIICNEIPYMYCKPTNWCDLCVSKGKCNIMLCDFEHGGQKHVWICSECFKFLGLKKNGYDRQLKYLNFIVNKNYFPKDYTDKQMRDYKKLINAK